MNKGECIMSLATEWQNWVELFCQLMSLNVVRFISQSSFIQFSLLYFCHTDVQKTRKSKYLKSKWWGSPREATRLTRNGFPLVNYYKTLLVKCSSYYGSICGLSLLFDLLLAGKGYSLGSLLFPSPQKNPNLNFFWKAVTQFKKCLRTPRCYYS